MRVAIVHYWLVTQRGGEAVVESLLDIYPEADVFTHVLDKERVSPRLADRVKACTFINRLPGAKKLYPYYLPLMPLALRLLDLRSYDLVIVSESGPAKGFRAGPETVQVCYCHSPMRYVWDQQAVYLARFNPLIRAVLKPVLAFLRRWDQRTAASLDYIVCNSNFVKERVKRCWQRQADVVYPPVSIERFSPASGDDGYYLYFGQLVPYKRPDTVVEAFNRLGKSLVVAGEGEMAASLQAQAAGNIHFTGRVSDEEAQSLLAGCKALVFPGEEDFGIVPVEAMACGKPVLALGRGGATETVIEGVTGLFYDEPCAEALIKTVEKFESADIAFNASKIRAHAQTFSTEHFRHVMAAKLNQFLAEREQAG